MHTVTKKNDKSVIRGWSFFDWANSAYALVISTAVFPPFFSATAPATMSFFGVSLTSTALYSFSISFAFLLNAIMTPFLSGLADYSGRRLFFLKFFTILGSIACMSLFFFDGPDTAWLGLTSFVLGTIGFGACVVFYNSYLPDIVTEDRLDKVSAQGYAYGYIGSVILLLIILALIHFKDALGFTSDSLPVRIGFLLVGIWWYGFALLTFRVLPKENKLKFNTSFLSKGLKEVTSVLKLLLQNKNITLFLTAYFFFIAGVNVVIYLAAVFAEDVLDFGRTELIILILLLQFLAMIGAYFFAFLSSKIGNKVSLLIQVAIWIAICTTAYFVTGSQEFYILSCFVGLVFGGIQSLSRSTYSKMLDDNIESMASYFSFYDVLTKLAVVAGTFIWGLVNQLTNNMRYSILSIAIFFVISFFILLAVKVERKQQ
jgi:UMF1 family MFS transporter